MKKHQKEKTYLVISDGPIFYFSDWFWKFILQIVMSAEKEQKLQIQTIFWQTKALYPIGSNLRSWNQQSTTIFINFVSFCCCTCFKYIFKSNFFNVLYFLTRKVRAKKKVLQFLIMSKKGANSCTNGIISFEQVQNSFHDHWLKAYSIWEISLKTFLET